MTEVLSALLGTLVGSLISWFIGNRQKKLQATFDLHREFHSGELYKSRVIANRLISNNLTASLDEILQKFPEEEFHLLQVANFYQRLHIAIKHQQINLELVPDLFGEVFVLWYEVFFRDQLLKSNTRSYLRNSIIALHKWLREDPKSSKEFYEWEKSASTDVERRLKHSQLHESSD